MAHVASLAQSPRCAHYAFGATLDGRSLDMLAFGRGPLQLWVAARQHPGESMAEWFAEVIKRRVCRVRISSLKGVSRKDLGRSKVITTTCVSREDLSVAQPRRSDTASHRLVHGRGARAAARRPRRPQGQGAARRGDRADLPQPEPGRLGAR